MHTRIHEHHRRSYSHIMETGLHGMPSNGDVGLLSIIFKSSNGKMLSTVPNSKSRMLHYNLTTDADIQVFFCGHTEQLHVRALS